MAAETEALDVRGSSNYANIPPQIQALNRFVLWRYEMVKDRLTKVPYRSVTKKAQTNNPATWNSFRGILTTLEENRGHFSGIGIVLGDGITGIDLDTVILEDGTLRPEAAEIVEALPGYVEKSPSGTGLHILIRGALPKDRTGLKFGFDGFGVEFYDQTSPRYLTLTGDIWDERSVLNDKDASEAIESVFRRVAVAFNATKVSAKEKKKKSTSVAVVDFDDEALLQKARRSKNGDKFSALYDQGDWRSHFPSASEGVASLLMRLAFWTGKDETRMDRLFRASALYDPKKWGRPQSGSTLGAIEIRNACEHCRDVYEPKRAAEEFRTASFIEFPDVGGRGRIKATLGNLEALLQFYGIGAYYDEIGKKNHVVFRDGDDYSIDNRSNAALARLTSICEVKDMPVLHMRQFIYEIADRRRVNPVRQWIVSKPWDGVDRLLPLCDTITTGTAFPNDLKELFIRKWLLSAVAAACHDPKIIPFSSRGVLVLAGAQNLGKTRWIRRLAPQAWVRDAAVLDPADKDSVREVISHWIVELGEVESTLRRDLGRLKAFFTKEMDKLRLPFSIELSEFPRRTVFAASVNKPDFLVDSTGNSRFLVIPCIDVDYEHAIDMQQVFAQLYLDWRAGEQWWLTREENARLAAENECFSERDEIFDLLTSRIDWGNFEDDLKSGRVTWLNATDVLIKRCGLASTPTKAQQNSAAAALRKLTGRGEKRDRTGNRLYAIPGNAWQ